MLPQVFQPSKELEFLSGLGHLWLLVLKVSSALIREVFRLHTLKTSGLVRGNSVLQSEDCRNLQCLDGFLRACPQVAPACLVQEFTLSLGREDLRERRHAQLQEIGGAELIVSTVVFSCVEWVQVRRRWVELAVLFIPAWLDTYCSTRLHAGPSLSTPALGPGAPTGVPSALLMRPPAIFSAHPGLTFKYSDLIDEVRTSNVDVVPLMCFEGRSLWQPEACRKLLVYSKS